MLVVAILASALNVALNVFVPFFVEFGFNSTAPVFGSDNTRPTLVSE
jgi:hypothetical protein